MLNIGGIMQSQKEIIDSLLDIIAERDRVKHIRDIEKLDKAISSFREGTQFLMDFIRDEATEGGWKS